MEGKDHDDANEVSSAGRLVATGIGTLLFGFSTVIEYAGAVGYLCGPPFCPVGGFIGLVSGVKMWDVPVEFSGLIWSSGLLAAYLAVVIRPERFARVAVDRIAFYTAVPLAGAVAATIPTTPPLPWLSISPKFPVTHRAF